MGVTTEQEHEYSRSEALRDRERILNSDSVEKVRNDPGYAEKVALIERAISGTQDWILDLGSGSCGESEYLATLGYKIICSDINEVALQLSQERCARFGRPPLRYLPCDAQNLDLEDESVSFVFFNESLHHMPDEARALAHAVRVLKPGGRMFLYEPYKYNPYRRLSEVRDYFRGTVERSFGVRELKRLLRDAGMEVISVERHVLTASSRKLQTFSPMHSVLRRLYVGVSKRMLWLFGSVMIVAQKQAAAQGAASTSAASA
jgi:ubiquinone/menaquinone biosynthesis C-methylase UbiE